MTLVDCSGELLFIVGEFYVKKILRVIRKDYANDMELEFKFKIIRALILKAMKNDLYKNYLNQVLESYK